MAIFHWIDNDIFVHTNNESPLYIHKFVLFLDSC